MAWSDEQISEHQRLNKIFLDEVNATLRPDKGLSGKVGIFLPGQNGDLMTAMSILQYRDEVFGKKEIIWFANLPNADALKYAPISEVRPWPWAGNGLPEGTPDFWPLLMNENNRLNTTLAKAYELTADLDDGYFPAPYMLEPQKRQGIDYPNCSRKVFGIPKDYPWHPVLNFSEEEVESAFSTIAIPGKKILFETFAGSGQSKLNEQMVRDAMDICRERWPGCSFMFASHKFLNGQESFPEDFPLMTDVYFCSHFTVRQCALISDYCDLIISVSSGITVACSRWGRAKVPILQFCGSFICSTKSLVDEGELELITADGKELSVAKKEFETALKKILNQSK